MIHTESTPACPTWCLAHIPVSDGNGTHHLGVDRTVPFTGGGPAESGWAAVAIERLDEPGHTSTPTEVHLDTTGGPMKPTEALQLSVALQRAAFGALGLGAGDWASTERWAHEFLAQPAVDTDGIRIQAIVADLLAQAQDEL